MTRVLTRRLPGQGLDKAEAAELSVSASQGTIWPFPWCPERSGYSLECYVENRAVIYWPPPDSRLEWSEKAQEEGE